MTASSEPRPPAGNGAHEVARPTVVLRDVTVHRGERLALDGATTSFGAGQVTALIGPNGAGKSTLLDAVAGLLPLRSGTIEVFGHPARAGHERSAYVLQHTAVSDALPLTVREVVAMGRYGRLGPFRRLRAADRQAVEDAMARLAVADLADRQLRDLSGGQRQRVFVAQGLASEADLLLLDEPVTGVDLVSRRLILDALTAERDRGSTVVHTTHDLSDAATADRVVLLAGRVVAQGPPAATLTAEHLGAAYPGQLIHVSGDQVLLDLPHHHHHP